MQIIRSLEDLREWRRLQRRNSRCVGFVPTMGFLHEGHLTLCRSARPRVDQLCASIFVNPLQFGPREDLSRYPRDEAGDLTKLESVGVDMVFFPSVEHMYPAGFCTEVQVRGLTDGLCGASRPDHFKGVTTVVAKLFHLVGPDLAWFGLKDYQQFRVIERMVLDLGMDVQVLGVPTVREPDGLAMSSRNAYLSPVQRHAALVLSRALGAARDAFAGGETLPQNLRSIALAILQAEPLANLDYLELVDARTLGEPSPDRPMLLAMAVKFGTTRLIDNVVLEPAG